MRRALVSIFLFGMLLTDHGEGTERQNEVYLRGSTGPYRGRVVDIKTKAPIAEAVVVAVWYQDITPWVPLRVQFYDALEVTSDAQGYFVVDAADIEKRAPALTRFPRFTVFKPEYTYYTGWLAPASDQFQRQNRSLLGTVELLWIGDLDLKHTRRHRVPVHPPMPDVPREKYPRLIKAFEIQSQKMYGVR